MKKISVNFSFHTGDCKKQNITSNTLSFIRILKKTTICYAIGIKYSSGF